MTGGFYDVRFSKLEAYKAIRKLENDKDGKFINYRESKIVPDNLI